MNKSQPCEPALPSAGIAPALQRAIDDCSRRGGGTVEVPPGVHRVGGLRLRSGVTVEGVDGPLARSWGGVADPVLENAIGFDPSVVPASEPFRTAAI